MPQLYSRVFVKILESSLADDWKARFVFEDFLKLANEDGVVDMTKAAIARRTNVPLEVVTHGISVLEAPDPGSRDTEEDGRRIVRLDDHRDWGWRIVNFIKYDAIRSNIEHRNANARRMARYRAKKASETPPAPPQFKDSDKDTERDSEGPSLVGNPSTTCSLQTPVEPPPGFPRSEAEAAEWAKNTTIDPEFASTTWSMAASRGFRDAKNIPIRSWQHYLVYNDKFSKKRESNETARPASGMALRLRIEALEGQYAKHPGNRNSKAYDRDKTTDAQRADAKAIFDEIQRLKRGGAQ